MDTLTRLAAQPHVRPAQQWRIDGVEEAVTDSGTPLRIETCTRYDAFGSIDSVWVVTVAGEHYRDYASRAGLASGVRSLMSTR